MASYELVFKRSVAKDLRDLPRQDIRRIMQRTGLLSMTRGQRAAKGCQARNVIESGKALAASFTKSVMTSSLYWSSKIGC